MYILQEILQDPDRSQILAHKGFLNAARALKDQITTRLMSFVASGSMDGDLDIIFTGHSAGGAVAMLLYAHFLTNAFESILASRSIHLNLITFGAPPIFSRPIDSMLALLPDVIPVIGKGVQLALTTEGDPVPRLDSVYAPILTGIYLSTNSATFHTVELVPGELMRAGNGNLPPFVRKILQQGITPRRRGEFPLPELSLWGIGETVVLISNRDATTGEIKVQARKLEHSDLGGMLCADVAAHKLNEKYLRLVEMLSEGKFNGHDGWVAEIEVGMDDARLWEGRWGRGWVG